LSLYATNRDSGR